MSTVVKKLGFELNLPSWIPPNSFYKYILDRPQTEFSVSGYKCVTFSKAIDNYIVTLVLLLSGDKKSVESFKNSSGEWVVRKRVLQRGESSTEPSIVVYNPSSSRGLFYSYFKGLSLSKLQSVYIALAKQLRRIYINDLNAHNNNIGKKVFLKNFEDLSEIKGIVTNFDLDNIMNTIVECEKISINHIAAIESSPFFSPLTSLFKSPQTSVLVNNEQRKKQSFFDLLKSTLSPHQRQLTSALKIMGKLRSGEQREFTLGNNLDDFGSMPYDDYIDLMPNRKWVKYSESNAASELINDAKDWTASLGTPNAVSSWLKRNLFEEIDRDSVIGGLNV